MGSKVKTVNRTKKKKLHEESNLKYLTMLTICIIVVLGPFLRGLFFEKEIVPVETIIFILFICMCISKIIQGEKIEVRNKMSLAVFMMPLVYLIPLILLQAVHKHGAVDYIMRYFMCAAVFLIASDYTKTKKDFQFWLYAIALTGVISGILCMDGGLGNKMNLGLSLRGTGFIEFRVHGILQYGNVSGAFYGTIIIVLITCGLLKENKIMKSIWAACIPMLFLSLILTMSRGALLVFLVAYVLYFIMLPEKKLKIDFVLLSFLPIIGGTAALPFLFKNVTATQEAVAAGESFAAYNTAGWLIVVAVTAMSFGVTFFILRYEERFIKIENRNYFKFILSLVAVLVLLVILFFATGLYKSVLPEAVVDRFTLSGTAEENTSGRTNLYTDGMRAIKNYWLLGAGGGAWNSVYRKYQLSIYDSTEPHNIFIQIFLDTGIIGVLALLFLFVTVFLICICNRKKENGSLIVMASLCAWIFLGHSIIDFGMSYVYVMLLVFILLGCVSGLSEKEKFNFKMPSILCAALVLGLTVINCIFMTARVNATKATTVLLDSGEVTMDSIQQAINYLDSATGLAPWNTNYYICEKFTDSDFQIDYHTLFTNLERGGEVSQDILNRHLRAVDKALELDGLNPSINVKAAELYLNLSLFDEGLLLLENSVQYNPMEKSRYETLAQGYTIAAASYEATEDEESARKMYERIVKIPEEVEAFNLTAREPVILTDTTNAMVNDAMGKLE